MSTQSEKTSPGRGQHIQGGLGGAYYIGGKDPGDEQQLAALSGCYGRNGEEIEKERGGAERNHRKEGLRPPFVDTDRV